jgi:hypothetical protein
MPHASYTQPFCPWPNCDFRFDNIDFRLEHVDLNLYRAGLVAWHAGLSLIGPCPRCGNNVAFSRDEISRGDAAAAGSVSLPPNWHESAEVTGME